MKQIKAIQTRYKGHHFRSRLEARYAVLFDALGFRWDYEPEGYDLDGVYYLPDFHLPDFNCWIEIKGGEPTDSELDKCRSLSSMLYGKSNGSDSALTFDPMVIMDMVEGLNKKDGSAFIKNSVNKKGKVYLFSGLGESGYLTVDDCSIQISVKNVLESFLFFGEEKRKIGIKTSRPFHPRKIFPECVNKARSARFEHGETPL